MAPGAEQVAKVSPPAVTVLMAVRNGAPDLPAQLDSLRRQTDVDWQLIASDDGSTDASPSLLQSFAATAPAQIIAGPGCGFVQNFLALLLRAPASRAVALSDQDDVWFPDKLARALAQLNALPADRPALYCSRRLNWQPESDRRQLSRSYPHPPAFANALVENIASGNTIVMNAAAAKLACDTAAAAKSVAFHDWWLYLLISGAGGTVIHDPVPSLLYRQHAQSVLGQGEGFLARIRVRRGVLAGSYSERIEQNLQALQQVSHVLTPENRARLNLFIRARRSGLLRRLILTWQAGVWRQGRIARLEFWGVLCLGRV